MSAVVKIPTQLRAAAGGEAAIDVPGSTVAVAASVAGRITMRPCMAEGKRAASGHKRDNGKRNSVSSWA